MKRRGTLVYTAFLTTLFSLAMPAGQVQGAESPSLSAGISPPAVQAFSQLSACVAAGDPLFALFVVDESLSLKQTDPDAARRVALHAAIDSLSQLGDEKGGSVHTALATFADDYTRRIPWGRLDGARARRLGAFADHEVPHLNTGTATDYRNALTSAAASMDRAVGKREACQVMFWFTDGGLDVDAGPAADREAFAEICQPHGVVDAMRRRGVYILAFGLLAAEGAGSVTPKDRTRLQAIAEGSSPGERCGTTPITPPDAPGAYLPAAQAGLLRGLFETAVARIDGYTPEATVSCPGERCRGGLLRIPLDDGIRYARLVVVPEGDPSLELTGPTGESLRLPASGTGTSQLDGAEVTTQSNVGVTRIDIDLPVDASHGDWSIAVGTSRGRDNATVEVYRSSGLLIEVRPASLVATAGETTRYAAHVVDREGNAADPEVWSRFALRGSAGDEQAAPLAQHGSAWRGGLDIPSKGYASSVPLTLTLDLVTKPNNLALTPVTLTTTVKVRPPPTFPEVTPAALVLDDLIGDGATSGTLRLRGSDEGDTKVCVGRPTSQAPEEAGSVSWKTSDRCIRLEAGEKRTITVTADPANAADGLVDGVIPITLTGVRAEDEASIDVPASFTMTRPVDEVTRWAVAASLAVLALLVPFLVLWLAGTRAARFRYEAVKTADIDVQLTSAGPRRPGDLRAFEVRPDEYTYRTPPDGRTSVDLGRLRLHARARLRTLFEPQAVARATDGVSAVAGRCGRVWLRPSRLAECPAELGGTTMWFVLVEDLDALEEWSDDQPGWSVPARLVVFRPDDTESSREQAADSLSGVDNWSELVAPLAAVTRQHRPATGRGVDSEDIQYADTAAAHESGARDTPSAPDRAPEDPFSSKDFL